MKTEQTQDQAPDQARISIEMTRALRDCEVDAVISSGGVALLRQGEIAADLSRAVHEERVRLSCVLHDQLQQLLIACRHRLDLAASLTDSDEVRSVILKATDCLQEAIKESRSLAVELDPPALTRFGLCGGLEWLAGWMHERFGLAVDCDITDDAEPEEEGLKLLLYHGCRELLMNVVKHAGTKTATLSLHRAGTMVVMTVTDNGKGMSEAGNSQSVGLGLDRFRRAVEPIQGSFNVVAPPGGGMSIQVTVPARTAR
jgi:signal transduction histidine kinase